MDKSTLIGEILAKRAKEKYMKFLIEVNINIMVELNYLLKL